MGWINYVLVVGICYDMAMSVGVVVLLRWSPSSISIKQYTTQSAAVRVVQQYYVMYDIEMGGYT